MSLQATPRSHKGWKGAGGRIHLVDPCQDEGKGREANGMLKTASGSGQCQIPLQGEICGQAEDYKTVFILGSHCWERGSHREVDVFQMSSLVCLGQMG